LDAACCVFLFHLTEGTNYERKLNPTKLLKKCQETPVYSCSTTSGAEKNPFEVSDGEEMVFQLSCHPKVRLKKHLKMHRQMNQEKIETSTDKLWLGVSCKVRYSGSICGIPQRPTIYCGPPYKF
jgi:hypothetical protein